jgi:hypothetical protein
MHAGPVVWALSITLCVFLYLYFMEYDFTWTVLKKYIGWLCFMATLVLLGTGCHPHSTRITDTASGRVTDQTTGKGIPFVLLGLIEHVTYNDPPDTFASEGHFRTDATGFYSITYSYNAETSNGRGINAIAKNYFDDYPFELSNSANDIQLMPKAFLKIHFSTTAATDTVIFRETIRKYKHNQFIVDKNYTDTICQNKFLLKEVNGNMMNKFSWMVIKNGIRQNFSDSLKVNSFDSASYSITF